MAAKKPKSNKKPGTNRGEPGPDIYQQIISQELKGQKLSPTERSEVAQRMRFENDYIDREDMRENQRRSRQASKARQGKVNLAKSKASTPKTTTKATPKASLYNRITGGGRGTVGAGGGLGDYTLR